MQGRSPLSNPRRSPPQEDWRRKMKKMVAFFLFLSMLFIVWAPPLRPLAADGEHPWPMFMHDAQHTGRSPYEGSASSQVKWALALGEGIGINSVSVAEDGTVYCLGEKNLYAIRPEGTIKWSYPIPNKLKASFKTCPALSQDGRVIFSTTRHTELVSARLIALNSDGSEAWFYEAEDIRKSPTLWQGEIFFGSQDGNCYRLNLKGELISYVPTGGPIEHSPAVSPDGTYYIGSADGYLYAAHPGQGVKWKFPVGEELLASPSVGPDGTIYFPADDRKLHAINPEGEELWSINFGSVCTPAIGPDGTLYLGNLNGVFYALSPSDGQVKWRFETGNQIYSSAAIGSNGNIYFGSRDHKVYALRPDGSLLWSFETGGSVDSSPAIAADGTLYIGSADGNLYAFGVPESPSIRIIQPGERETVTLGQAYEIKWETLNPPQDVYMIRVELSLDGDSYRMLAQGQDTGSYSWTPDSTCEHAQIRISLFNSGMEKLAEATSGVFRIVSSISNFADLPSDYWAESEIMLLTNNGVINGYPDGTFRPENPVTRAEFAKMILLTLGYSPELPENPTFPDVPRQEWYYRYVQGAVKHGLVEGYPDGSFKPEGNITIAEVLTVIVRARELSLTSPPGPPPFILIEEDDSLRQINPEDWFYGYVGAAANNALILFPDYPQITIPGPGAGDYYIVKFNGPATRAQTAVFLARLMRE